MFLKGKMCLYEFNRNCAKGFDDVQLNPEKWEELSNINGLVNNIFISINAATEETYKKISGNVFIKLLKNLAFIKSLKQRNIIKSIIFNFVVMNSNVNEMKKFILLARKYCADRIIFLAVDDWTSFAKKEYFKEAIHKPGHPEHFKLINVLKDPIFDDDDIFLGYFKQFRNKK